MTNYKRLWEQITLPYNGDVITFSDNSAFKAATGKALAYSSTYSDLLTYAPWLLSSAVNMNWPINGVWDQSITYKQIIWPTSGTWVLITSDSTYYYTSSNSGSTWTRRTLPWPFAIWTWLWDGTNYILYTNSNTTNAGFESTDGITWTARTIVSLTVKDIIYNWSVYLTISANATTASTSPDRITWTSRTLSTTSSNITCQPWNGFVTWNAWAWLFIVWAWAQHTYMTSPNGDTWTTRTTAENFTFSNWLFASSSTRTVYISAWNWLYTTDGINWTYCTLPDEFKVAWSTPLSVFYDGTRFVAIFLAMSFYSTDGITWVKATRANMSTTSNALWIKTPTGFLGINALYWLHITDFSSTANTSIVAPTSALTANLVVYYCIAEWTWGGGSGGWLTTEEHDRLFALPTSVWWGGWFSVNLSGVTWSITNLQKNLTEKIEKIPQIDLNEIKSHIDIAKNDVIDKINSIEIPEAILEEKEAKKALKLIQGVDKKLTSYIDSEMNEKEEIGAITREFKFEMEEKRKETERIEKERLMKEEEDKKEKVEDEILLEEIKKEFEKQDEIEKEEKRKELEQEIKEMELEMKEKEKELKSL